ncbi:NIPSNAP family protein [Gordonia sp. Z-3]|uniref:NIPSNAP family protein n=1 Tax=Gordonia sp. Z-3 TaxID=3115408 RepID=UPI002E29017A|nr:NIPSNAP family protein [Gordonia sp. Z-3]MED5803833.1 NIPSNAP family protein [Gordonia sp. Z-3]
MLYEVREYVAVPGRLPAIIDLFNQHTIRLFAKHDMDLIQVGRTWIGENSYNELVYTLRFSDVAELEKKWEMFLQDPEWVAELTAREAEGPMVASMRRRLVDPGPFADAEGLPAGK